MAQVKYIGEFPAEKDSIIQHGYEFGRNESVTVTDTNHLAKLSANRFFEVSRVSEADDTVRRGPGRPRKEAD